jgi:hypothetical protein
MTEQPKIAVWKDGDGDYVVAQLEQESPAKLLVESSSNGAYFTREQWEKFAAGVLRILDGAQGGVQ